MEMVKSDETDPANEDVFIGVFGETFDELLDAFMILPIATDSEQRVRLTLSSCESTWLRVRLNEVRTTWC